VASRAHPNAGLSQAEVDELERALLQRARELRTATRQQESLLEADDSAIEPVDRADEERRFRDAALLGGAEQHELAAINAALERLNNGTYGVSELSGAALGIERLRAVPYASRTVTETEHDERRARSADSG
jgi:DnaK suppressor protein